MKILVTGGAGFIGSHLVDRLIEHGHHVVCVDNLITGAKENVAHHLKSSTFTLYEKDAAQPLPQSMFSGVEQIYHLASPASPKSYLEYPVETMAINSFGTSHLLEVAHKRKIRFLLASTSEVYGDPAEHPQEESYWGHVNPIGIRSCYDESKRFAESLTMVYIRKYRLDARIVRIFNTYGPRLQPDDGRVISNFITQALAGKKLTIYGDGSQTRSFCYVQDLVGGLLAVMNEADARGNVYNLGNPEEFTVERLAGIIERLVGQKLGRAHKPLPADDPKQRQPDLSKIKKEIGWEPRVPLEQGLKETISFFQSKKSH